MAVGELLPLSLPVDFEGGGADDEGGIGVGTMDDAYALQGFPQSRFVADENVSVAKSEFDAFFLIGVGGDAKGCGHSFF